MISWTFANKNKCFDIEIKIYPTMRGLRRATAYYLKSLDADTWQFQDSDGLEDAGCTFASESPDGKWMSFMVLLTTEDGMAELMGNASHEFTHVGLGLTNYGLKRGFTSYTADDPELGDMVEETVATVVGSLTHNFYGIMVDYDGDWEKFLDDGKLRPILFETLWRD